MKIIYNKYGYSECIEQISALENIYNEGFPDINEREDFKMIIKRIIGDRNEAEPNSIILITEHENEVTGGLFIDWYKNSQSLHLIYIVINRNFRNQGIAKSIIKKGIDKIISLIDAEYQIKIKNVFFESNNPLLTKNGIDSFDPSLRLKIFSRLGAGRINIPYIQPALSLGQESVNHLFLLSFPHYNKSGNKIPVDDVLSFLADLYRGLNASCESKDFRQMREQCEFIKDENRCITLEPLMDSPKFEFQKASVTFHYMDEDLIEQNTVLTNSCISSFECDLMNYQGQKNRPFKSSFIRKVQDVKLILPSEYEYTSEGLSHYRISNKNIIDINVSVSVTYFKASERRMWHLTISPALGDYFSEYDLIKLSSAFGSAQEGSIVKNHIGFILDNLYDKNYTDIALLEYLINNSFGSKINRLNAGVVQLDIQDINNIENAALALFFNPVANSFSNEKIFEFSKVLCGIILGIFDFQRMSNEEIFDTIQPCIVNQESYTIISRGTLIKIACNDEMMVTVLPHLIVSPYLLIPNMVLAHNEYILTEAKCKVDQALDIIVCFELNALEKQWAYVSKIINMQCINNVFQYPSEQNIIKIGNEQRGILLLKAHVVDRLSELAELIRVKRENKSNISDALLNSFLGLIAFIQLFGVFIDNSDGTINKIIFYLSAILISISIFLIVRRKKH